MAVRYVYSNLQVFLPSNIKYMGTSVSFHKLHIQYKMANKPLHIEYEVYGSLRKFSYSILDGKKTRKIEYMITVSNIKFATFPYSILDGTLVCIFKLMGFLAI
jgi:hypothetical protein